MLALQDVKDYLGIDYADTMQENVLNSCISAADSYLQGAIGTDYPADDPRAVELAKIIVADLYDTRGMNEKVSGNVRRLVSDFTLQLQMERRAKNGV